MDRKQLIKHVIASTLYDMKCWSQPAEDLLVMIAAHESNKGEYIHQIEGPAVGIFQMEPRTHDDIMKFLKHQRPVVYLLLERYTGIFHSSMMAGNLYYATAMARSFFMRFPEAIPSDHKEMAEYAKLKWNTEYGKATPEDYLEAFEGWK